MPQSRPQRPTLIEFGRLPVRWDPTIKGTRISGEARILYHDLDAIWRATGSSSIELGWDQIQASQGASLSAARRWVAALERAGLVDVVRHGDGSVTMARPGGPVAGADRLRVIQAAELDAPGDAASPEPIPDPAPEAAKDPAGGGRPEPVSDPANAPPHGSPSGNPTRTTMSTSRQSDCKVDKAHKGTTPQGPMPIGDLALWASGWLDRSLGERRRIARQAADRIRAVIGDPQWWVALRIEDYILAGEIAPEFCGRIADEFLGILAAKAEAQAAGLRAPPVGDRQKYLFWLIRKRAHWIDWSKRPP